MTVIVASITFIVQFAWMLILMYAAFEAALYLLSMAAALYAAYCELGYRAMIASPWATLKDAHARAMQSRKAQSFLLV